MNFVFRLWLKILFHHYKHLNLWNWIKFGVFKNKKNDFVYYQNKKIYIDSKVNFLFQFDEIFNKQIYCFKSNKQNPIIIDCGSNIGLSILFFKQLFPSSQIIGFEPNPTIFNLLYKNILTSSFESIQLFQEAIWSSNKKVSFNNNLNDASQILIKEFKDNILVDAISLKPYLDKDIDFLKLDIEGAELEVLQDIAPCLGRVRHLFVEYHSYQEQEQRLNDLLSILSTAGFRYYIERTGVYSARPYTNIAQSFGMDLQLNIFAYRTSNI